MSTTRRFFFGLISALFLSVGLARAAEHFDPMHVNGHSDKTISFGQHGNGTVAEDTNSGGDLGFPPI